LIGGFGLASFKAYITIQTTIIGYKIGQMKQTEADLLESQSTLKMELAKITRRESLMNMAAEANENHQDVWAAH
jgi:regulator of replication initiation timing